MQQLKNELHRVRSMLEDEGELTQEARRELADARSALEERKVIDRAKGILMRARGIGEEDAYALLRKTAMDQGRKLAEVAQALVMTADLLK